MVPGLEAESIGECQPGGSVAVLPGSVDEAEPATTEDLEELMMQGLVPAGSDSEETDWGDGVPDIDVEENSLTIIAAEDLLDEGE